MIQFIEYNSFRGEAEVVVDPEPLGEDVMRLKWDVLSGIVCANGISVDWMQAFFMMGKLHVV